MRYYEFNESIKFPKQRIGNDDYGNEAPISLDELDIERVKEEVDENEEAD